MKIINHWLVSENAAEKIVKDPSPHILHNITPVYLIIHYTAGDTASSAINWFKTPINDNPQRIAAHIVVDMDGTITQLVPFNARANHAGYSTWDKYIGMNIFSIGIEIVNPGFVEKLPDGTFKRWINKKKNQFKIYPASTSTKIIQTNHKHKFWTDVDNHHWFKYPQAQLDAVYALSKVIINQYHLVNAVGHDDISPARKPDPGPAFPWDEFKMNVLGRHEIVGKIFKVQSSDGFAWFRNDHDTNSNTNKKLSNGYEVGVIETFGEWFKVYLCDKIADIKKADDQSIKFIGWVHRSLLVEKV